MNNANSTAIKSQKRIDLPKGSSQRKYSINNVIKKYSNPIAKKRMLPLINSLV